MRRSQKMNEKRPYEEPKLELLEINNDVLTSSNSNWIDDEDEFTTQGE